MTNSTADSSSSSSSSSSNGDKPSKSGILRITLIFGAVALSCLVIYHSAYHFRLLPSYLPYFSSAAAWVSLLSLFTASPSFCLFNSVPINSISDDCYEPSLSFPFISFIIYMGPLLNGVTVEDYMYNSSGF